MWSTRSGKLALGEGLIMMKAGQCRSDKVPYMLRWPAGMACMVALGRDKE